MKLAYGVKPSAGLGAGRPPSLPKNGGEYYVAVTREGQRLVLWMLDTEVANTDWIQSAIDLREPLRLQSSYTQAMILALFWQPAPETVFLSGLGGGCLAPRSTTT